MAREQTATALNYIHSWSRIQDQIRARRICMITEARIKQKKYENQLKLEAKIHELEVVLSTSACDRFQLFFKCYHHYIAVSFFYFLQCEAILAILVCQEEWCSGSETMEEILSRIHQREEAAIKRERAMAYAFSHQVQNLFY